MSNIIFVRHAQASLFEADYDQLSELGMTQAQLLGQYLASQPLALDEIYIGPRRRHRQTLEAILQHAPQLACPLVELPQLDEHQVDRLATDHIDQLAREFPVVNKLNQDFLAANQGLERQRNFARLFEAVAELWVTDRCELYGIESWSSFVSRVNEGIDSIVGRPGSGRQVLVVTSAGTLSAALSRALDCPDRVALGLGWRIWNCSLTRFAFSKGRFSLDQFNTLPHLNDHSLWTYR